jgi:uncharacterized protein with von Willebrand factor type A (vWA) domain
VAETVAPPRVAGATDGRAERLVVAFAHLLRGAGLDVPLDAVLSCGAALTLTGVRDRDAAYWAMHATLVRRHEDTPLFDRAFAAFWDAREAPHAEPAPPPAPLTLALDAEDGADGEPEPPDAERQPSLEVRFSAVERLRTKDFANYDARELREAQRLMRRLRLAGTPRRSMRLVAAPRRGRHDLRRTVRAALRSGGEPVRRHWRRPGERLRRLVLVLDVSGSMEPYARALLRFVHAAVSGRQRVEAFTLGTRLTRITHEMATRDPDRALDRAAGQVRDWSGGTRLGECLRRFNDEWGVRGMARGAIVVVLSDGWDRGEPEVLAAQMRRLARVAHRVVWVNPLKVTPGYAPLARGMAAALPWVDDFVEGHSVEAMERLAEVISRPDA